MTVEAQVHGMWIEYSYDVRNAGLEAAAKYYRRMARLWILPASWTRKMVMLNVLLRAMWSYLNRHIVLPISVRQTVECRDLAFTTKVSFCALGYLTHLAPMSMEYERG